MDTRTTLFYTFFYIIYLELPLFNVHSHLFSMYTAIRFQCTQPSVFNVHSHPFSMYTSIRFQCTHPSVSNVHIHPLSMYTAIRFQCTQPSIFNVYSHPCSMYTAIRFQCTQPSVFKSRERFSETCDKRTSTLSPVKYSRCFIEQYTLPIIAYYWLIPET